MARFQLAANVSMMFKEYGTIAQRIAQAKACGFKYVEITAPYTESKDDIAHSLQENGVQCSLMNAWPVLTGEGATALTTLPGKQQEFKDKMALAIQHAMAFKTTRMHVLAGVGAPGVADHVTEETYVNNVRVAADLAAQEGLTVMVEAVNSSITCPGYFVDHPEKALALIKKIDRPNVKFQMDVFHFQICMGNLTKNIEKYLPYTDYIQISQAPNRSEPGSPGEIDYKYILGELTRLQYAGYIGLEYNPVGDTVQGLKWLDEFNMSL